MKISNKSISKLVIVLGIVLAVLLVVIFFRGRREGFNFRKPATSSQLICGLEYAWKNQKKIRSQPFKTYVSGLKQSDIDEFKRNVSSYIHSLKPTSKYAELNTYTLNNLNQNEIQKCLKS